MEEEIFHPNFRYSCDAIGVAAGYFMNFASTDDELNLYLSAKKYYAELFMPMCAWSDQAWFGEITDKNRNVRIVALCFAAAIAESEGK